MAEGLGRRSPRIHAERQSLVRGGGTRPGALPRAASVDRSAQREAFRHDAAAPSHVRGCSLGLSAQRTSHEPYETRRQRLHRGSATMAADSDGLRLLGTGALDHAGTPVCEPEAACRAQFARSLIVGHAVFVQTECPRWADAPHQRTAGRFALARTQGRPPRDADPRRRGRKSSGQQSGGSAQSPREPRISALRGVVHLCHRISVASRGTAAST